MSAPVTHGELQEEIARLTSNQQSEKLAIKAELDLLATRIELKIPDPVLLAVSELPPGERLLELESPGGRMLLKEQGLKDSLYEAVQRVRREFDHRTEFRDNVLNVRLTTILKQYDNLRDRIERLETQAFAARRR